MKTLLAGALVAAALALPAGPAAADDWNPAGIKECPPGYTGHVVWVDSRLTGYQEPVRFCIPWGP